MIILTPTFIDLLFPACHTICLPYESKSPLLGRGWDLGTASVEERCIELFP